MTAQIQARLIDDVERNGQITEGSATMPTAFNEARTFARPRRGDAWRLFAAHQQ